MSVSLYSLSDLVNIANAAVKAELPELDPTIPGSFIKALVTSIAIQTYTVQRNIIEAQKDFFPQTSVGDFLDFWAEIEGLTRVAGTVAAGRISVTGTASVTIPINTQFSSSSGELYNSTSSATITTQSGSAALSASGTTITAVTPVMHSLVDSMSVVISGAADADYNGTFSVNVLDEYTFQYTALSAPSASTASGSYSSVFADVPIQSINAGIDLNLSAGSVLTLVSTVSGVDAGTQGTVNRDGISGGADLEDDDNLRERVLLASSTDPGIFTNSQITLVALSVQTASRVFITNPSVDYTTDGTDVSARVAGGASLSGTTVTLDMTANGTDNIYVGSLITVADAVETEYNGNFIVTYVSVTELKYEITGSPSSPATGTITVSLDKLKNIPMPGTVYVFILDDSNDPPSPSSTTVASVKTAILEYLPAHMSEDNLVVSGPFFESIDITISNLSPNTSTMRSAIEDNLQAFFQDGVGFAEEVKLNKLVAAIQNTQDPETSEYVDSFELTSPTTDTNVSNGSLGILGTVTFA